MSKTLLVIFEILVNVIQQLVIVQSIIVERNLYSYYRLPISAVRRNNGNQEFFILQCPFKSSLNIPKPEEMEVCKIIDKYKNSTRDMEKSEEDMAQEFNKTTTRFKADHRVLKPPKEVKWFKLKMRKKPYKVYIKPYKVKHYYNRPKTEIKEQFKATNVRLYLDRPKPLVTTKFTLTRQPIHIEDSLSLSSSLKPKIVNQTTNKPSKELSMSNETDYDDDYDSDIDSEEINSEKPTALKFLGTKDVLSKLQQALSKDRPAHPKNASVDKSQKFFVESNKYKKGYKTKGYQNMYHRDEIYQDHIFYDDLQQKGNYDIYKNYKNIYK
ncbi:uncharacterized protein LOC142220143 [Haematobia irritans]|uniref:uncharacterized protein LOC142220143 n=1 Tax=Haematobia irritans TaxID=7368 RepID=UPI003F506975